jgi:glycosyltransferase involved in cell wall biosynthesis
MLHPGALLQKSFKKKIYLFCWKLLRLHKKNIFHATDEKEKEFIQQVFGKKAKIMIAANFPQVLPRQPVMEKRKSELKLISIALISPMKNILLNLQAINNIGLNMESLRQEDFSLIEYNIYGPVKDKRYWQECLELINKMPPGVKVNYHGDLQPDEIVNALLQNHVFILPSKSENFGHAIYEALTAGRPVITSNNTPWNNLETAKAGINVSVNDTMELVKAIEQFAGMNQEELKVWSDGARAYAGAAIDLDAIRQQYTRLFA